MAFNPRNTFTIDLSLFGSLITDINATDLPPGASPDNSDMFFLAGSTATRPAFKRMQPLPVYEQPDIMSVKDIRQVNGNWLTVFLDSNGLLWGNDPTNSTSSTILGSEAGTATPGSQFNAVNAFNKQFYAFRNTSVTSAFCESPFIGSDVPRYFDGTNIWQVTSDGPGEAPNFENVSIAPFYLVAGSSAATLTVTAALSGGQTTYYSPDGAVAIYWTSITYTCSSSVPTNWLNQTVTITGLTGTNSSLANTTGVITAVSGSTFTLSIYINASVSLSSESGSAVVQNNYLSRQNNIVTAFVGSTLPALLQPGYWVNIINDDGSPIQGDVWTAYDISQTTNGIVTVSILTQLTNLIPGTILYVQPNPITATITQIDIVSNVITAVCTNSFSAGQQLLLTGFTGGLAFFNGAIITLASASSSLFTANYTHADIGATGCSATATDTLSFPAGYQTVLSVVNASGGTTSFTYQGVATNTSNTIATNGGSVWQMWSPLGGIGGNATQIINVGETGGNYYFQWFQLGPDYAQASTGGTPTGQLVSQIAGGVRNGTVFFVSQNGAQTAPAAPIQFVSQGGTSFLSANNLPLGPSGTIQRTIAFTPAQGSNYYYTTPSTIPSVSGLAPDITTGTVIPDNISTTAFVEFSDAQLTSGTQIDAVGNDLFAQVVLAPCLGVIEYASRLFWWGEINNVKNFVNMGFDGGYNPPSGYVTVLNGSDSVSYSSGDQFQTGLSWDFSTIYINQLPFEINTVSSSTALTTTTNWTGANGTYPYYVLNPIGTTPTGWNVTGDGAGTLYPNKDTSLGFTYQMQGGYNNQISQTAYQTWDGSQILLPSTLYGFRARVYKVGPATAGYLQCIVQDTTTGYQTGTSIPLAGMTTQDEWYYGVFVNPTPATITPNMTMSLLLTATTAGTYLVVDDAEIIFANQPVVPNQLRGSYAFNPFGYDGETSLLDLDTTNSVTAAFQQREYLYVLTDEGLYQGKDNAQSEPYGWSIAAYADKCGASSPDAVDSAEDAAWWGGRYGGRVFSGNPSTQKITQEISTIWESINWTAQTSIWVKNDPVQKILYYGITTGTNTKVNKLLAMSHRLVNSLYDIPDPVHVSQYSGKMLCTDLSRKWSPWTAQMNAADMCTRNLGNGLAKTIMFAGTGYGNLYYQDTVNYPPLNPTSSTWTCSDDDYGAIPSYYTTYFWFAHDMEQQPILQQWNKVYNYLGIHVVGVGNMTITPYIDSLSNPWASLPPFPMQIADIGFDYHIPMFVKGNRVAFKMASSPISGTSAAFSLSHLLIAGRLDRIFPVRGSIFSI